MEERFREDIRGSVAMLAIDGAAFQGSEGLVLTSFHCLVDKALVCRLFACQKICRAADGERGGGEESATKICIVNEKEI